MFLHISEAVKLGKLTEETVRESVKPLFYTRMRLGLFDPPEINPYAALDPAVEVESEKHRKLSLISALKSFVLLKNDGLLPLTPGRKFSRIAVSTPHCPFHFTIIKLQSIISFLTRISTKLFGR